MKEKKYRVWHKEKHQMGFFDLDEIWFDVSISYGLDTWDKPTGDGYFAFKIDNMDEVEIMEYIGLKDESGKEIYEGDVLLIEDRRCLTIFVKGSFKFRFETDDNRYYAPEFASEGKVIGNIYENPERFSTKK